MAHPKHTHVPGDVYFVSSIAEAGRTVFVDDEDREALGERVGEVIARCGAQVHAFKWLADELLLILQVSGVSLSGVMQRITSVHARRVNQKLGRRGTLFQHSHRAVLLEDTESFLEAVATIHRHPRTAWSSHAAYLGLRSIPWLTCERTLNLLGDDTEPRAAAYQALLEQPPAWMNLDRPRLGKSSRVSLIRPYDQFARWLQSRSRERAKPATLEQLIAAVARWFELDPAIVSNEPSPLLSLARAIIVWYAMQNEIASLAELAKRFGRRKSTLHEARESYRLLAPELFELKLTELLEGPALGLSDVSRRLSAQSKR